MASPTRAHGTKYCKKSGKRMRQMIVLDVASRSTLLLEVMYQPTTESKRQT